MNRRVAVWALAASVAAPRGVVASTPLSDAALERARDDLSGLAREAARLEDGFERWSLINVAVNSLIDHRADGDVDDWATPGEALARGCGDCEDAAIFKLFLLGACGGPSGQHRLLYGRLRPAQRPGLDLAHMTALVVPRDGPPMVLDQANPLTLALPLRDDLQPLFSFDTRCLWALADEQPLHGRTLQARAWLRMLERARGQRTSLH
jgi:predicted transglutaminase-like cysteine proteinase